MSLSFGFLAYIFQNIVHAEPQSCIENTFKFLRLCVFAIKTKLNLMTLHESHARIGEAMKILWQFIIVYR